MPLGLLRVHMTTWVMKVRKKSLLSKEQNWDQHILLLFPYVNFAAAVDLRDKSEMCLIYGNNAK